MSQYFACDSKDVTSNITPTTTEILHLRLVKCIKTYSPWSFGSCSTTVHSPNITESFQCSSFALFLAQSYAIQESLLDF